MSKITKTIYVVVPVEIVYIDSGNLIDNDEIETNLGKKILEKYENIINFSGTKFGSFQQSKKEVCKIQWW